MDNRSILKKLLELSKDDRMHKDTVLLSESKEEYYPMPVRVGSTNHLEFDIELPEDLESLFEEVNQKLKSIEESDMILDEFESLLESESLTDETFDFDFDFDLTEELSESEIFSELQSILEELSDDNIDSQETPEDVEVEETEDEEDIEVIKADDGSIIVVINGKKYKCIPIEDEDEGDIEEAFSLEDSASEALFAIGEALSKDSDDLDSLLESLGL